MDDSVDDQVQDQGFRDLFTFPEQIGYSVSLIAGGVALSPRYVPGADVALSPCLLQRDGYM